MAGTASGLEWARTDSPGREKKGRGAKARILHAPHTLQLCPKLTWLHFSVAILSCGSPDNQLSESQKRPTRVATAATTAGQPPPPAGTLPPLPAMPCLPGSPLATLQFLEALALSLHRIVPTSALQSRS